MINRDYVSSAMHAVARPQHRTPEIGSSLRTEQKAGCVRNFYSNPESALRRAVNWGKWDEVQLALRDNADPNTRDKEVATMLMLAGRRGHIQIAELLLQNGANIDARGKMGWTALMEAAATNHPETAELLINWGASLDVQDYVFGRTALIWAMWVGNVPTAKLLLQHGADFEIEGKSCRTAFKWTISAKVANEISDFCLGKSAPAKAQWQ